MTSASTDVYGGPRQRARSTAPRWLLVGRLATIAALAGCVLLQWINSDWFPPEISVSQYGVGRRGWVFTCWTTLLALAVLALARGGPEFGPRQARFLWSWLTVGCVGLLVMGIVRTDAGGAQQSWHARTHMVAAILALLTMPVGIVLAMAQAGRPWRRAAVALTALSVAALLLVLASASGASLLGMDAPHSWAFWQSVAVTLDLVLVGVFALSGITRRDTPPRPVASE